MNADISNPASPWSAGAVTVPRDRILLTPARIPTPDDLARACRSPTRRSRPRPPLPADIPPREEATTRFQARAASSSLPRRPARSASARASTPTSSPAPTSPPVSRLASSPSPRPARVHRATTHVPKLARPGSASRATPPPRPLASPPRGRRRRRRDSSPPPRSAPSTAAPFSRDDFGSPAETRDRSSDRKPA